MTSVHSTLWAAGTVVTGLGYPPLTRRFGRRRVFWSAAAASVAGALLFVVGYRLPATLLAAAVLGTAGTALGTGTTGIMADEHGPRRDRAFIEANIGASATAVIAPVVFGGLAATVLGWRTAMAVPAVALAALWLRFRGLRLAAPGTASDPPAGSPAGPVGPATPGRLPGAYWLATALIAAVVGIEFCIVFYAALLLHAHDGMSTGRAAAALSVFYIGELAGRAGGSQLARTAGRSRQIIAMALAVTAAGFAAFWLTRRPDIAIAGLGVAGLGIANLYPFSLALAIAAAPGRTDQASGRAAIAVGAAVLAAPFALGALADAAGVVRAYLIEPGLIAAAVTLLFLPRPLSSRSHLRRDEQRDTSARGSPGGQP